MSYRVLIADDSLLIRRTLCELFERESDFTICASAQNGKEAVEKAKELRPDLILLDLSMPVMNGLDAARTLKQLMPKVPIIMFSMFSDSCVEKEAHSAGVSELVSKSQPASTLLGTARNLILQAAA